VTASQVVALRASTTSGFRLEARRAALVQQVTDLGVPAAELTADALGLG
jgi:hypothetical protein